MTHLVLLEDVPDGFAESPGDRLVALTPNAVAALDRVGLAHEVLADLVDDGALAALEDEYWDLQLDWFRGLGAALAERAPELATWQPGLPLAYNLHLKTLLDILFIRGFEIRSLLESGCDSVTLWQTEATEPALADDLYFRGPSVHSRLLGRFCDAAGIPHSEHGVAARLVDPAGLPPPALRRRSLGAGFDKVCGLVASLRRGRKTFLFVNALYDSYDLHLRARRRGHRCLLFQDGVLVDLSSARAREAFDLSVRPEPWTRIADELSATDSVLWDWPNSWFGLTITDLLAPRIHHFIEKVAPELVAEADRFCEANELFDVDFVCHPHVALFHEAAAAAAARLTARTQAVMIDHGDMVFAPKEADVGFLLCSDHLFVGNAETAAYYEARRRAYPERTAAVHVGSYRWEAATKLARSRRAAPARGRPVVVYVVTACGGDLRSLNSAWYSDAWYYRLQRRIVDVLAAHDEYDVVVKDFPPGSLKIENPIGDYACSLDLDHVSVSDAPFVEWLPRASRVIVDFPSTALYECALAKVPVVGLLYEHFKVRDSAVREFGASLVQFGTAEEAAGIVDGFLAAPDWPTLGFELAGDEILSTLEGL